MSCIIAAANYGAPYKDRKLQQTLLVDQQEIIKFLDNHDEQLQCLWHHLHPNDAESWELVTLPRTSTWCIKSEEHSFPFILYDFSIIVDNDLIGEWALIPLLLYPFVPCVLLLFLSFHALLYHVGLCFVLEFSFYVCPLFLFPWSLLEAMSWNLDFVEKVVNERLYLYGWR